jgi:hypothetical protein
VKLTATLSEELLAAVWQERGDRLFIRCGLARTLSTGEVRLLQRPSAEFAVLWFRSSKKGHAVKLLDEDQL